jgi:hypothetical protein
LFVSFIHSFISFFLLFLFFLFLFFLKKKNLFIYLLYLFQKLGIVTVDAQTKELCFLISSDLAKINSSNSRCFFSIFRKINFDIPTTPKINFEIPETPPPKEKVPVFKKLKLENQIESNVPDNELGKHQNTLKELIPMVSKKMQKDVEENGEKEKIYRNVIVLLQRAEAQKEKERKNIPKWKLKLEKIFKQNNLQGLINFFLSFPFLFFLFFFLINHLFICQRLCRKNNWSILRK